ncbi:neuropeptide Y receptor type 6-like [Octopus sinensis]|uniref:Neuropeptide Y receptor type 6-like n=1 Tax=Octopus sinensis TaxID=2607531 RepID=A0A6P7SJ34_9MOLL|nr:neuropeptide Y receptor type 6-like [Octopus sinensis]
MNATHLSDPVSISRLIVFSIIPFFLIVGLVGNIFVIYIYARQSQKSNVETFILILAVIDLIGCIFGMPLEMAELCLVIQSKYLCKLYTFITVTYSILSSFILLTIAIERYRSICCPLSKQLDPKLRNTLIIFLIVTSVSLVLLPVVYIESVPFSHESYSCDFQGSFLWPYILTAFIIQCILVLSMAVLYSFVQKNIKQHLMKKQSKEPFQQEQINHTKIILFSISVLYFVSFTPNLLFRALYPYCRDSILLQIFKVILYRTWILSSSLNFIVYGFCNKIFWKSFVNIFSRDKSDFEMDKKF